MSSDDSTPSYRSYSLERITALSAAIEFIHDAKAGPEMLTLAQRDLGNDELLQSLLVRHREAVAKRRAAFAASTATEDDELRLALRSLGLSARESDVMAGVMRGRRDAEIAAALGISPKTVSKHVEHILAKLRVETRAAAAAEVFAWAQGRG